MTVRAPELDELTGAQRAPASCDDAPVEGRLVAKPCPLCRGPIEVRERIEPHAVVCPSCGLSCTIEAPPPPPVVEPVAATDEDGDASAEASVVHWLERQPPRPAAVVVSRLPQPPRPRRISWREARFVAAVILLAFVFRGRNASAPVGGGSCAGEPVDMAAQQVDAGGILDSQLTIDRQRRERGEEEARRESVEREVRRVTAKYLAAKADGVVGPDSLRGVALAVEAVQATLSRGEPIVPEAHQALRDALGRCANAHRIDCIALPGHQGPVVALAASPDGRWLATGGDDQVARLWNLAADDPAAAPIVLRHHRARVNNLAASPDGRWLATSSRDATVCVWDLSASDPARTPTVLPGHRHPVTGMTLSPDGRWLATYCANANGLKGSAQLWDLAAGVETAAAIELTGLDGLVRDAAMSPDSRWLALAVDQSVRLWDLKTREPAAAAHDLQLRQGVVAKVLFTADGQWLATCGAQGSSGGIVRLWPLSAGDFSASAALDSGLPAVRAMAVSADGRWLVAAGEGDRVVAWDLKTVESQPRRIALRGGPGPYTAVQVSPDSRWVAAIGAGGSVAAWELTPDGPAEAAVVLRGGKSQLLTLVFSPDSQWIAAAGLDGAVRLWTLDVNQLVDRAAVLAAGAAGRMNLGDALLWDAAQSAARHAIQFVRENDQCAALAELVEQSAAWTASQSQAIVASALSSDATFDALRDGPTRYQPVAFARRPSMQPSAVRSEDVASTPVKVTAPGATVVANPTVASPPMTAIAAAEMPVTPEPTIAPPETPAVDMQPIDDPDWAAIPVALPPVESENATAAAVVLVGPELSPQPPQSGPRSIVKRIVKAITPSRIADRDFAAPAPHAPARTAVAESKSPAVERR